MTFEGFVTGILLLAVIASWFGYKWSCSNVFLKCKEQLGGACK